MDAISTPPPPSTFSLEMLSHLRNVTYARFLRTTFALINWLSPSQFFPPTRTLSIPSTADSSSSHSITLHIYDPPASNDAGPKPVHITWHGSGFIIPSLGGESRFCDTLAREAGCIVIDADYRKAPEYPFPAAYYDALSVVRWVLSDPEGMHFDTSRVSVGGFSAGANFAAALVGQFPPDTFRAVVVLYPALDCSVPFNKKPPPPAGKHAGGVDVDASTGTFFFNSYIGQYPNPADPRLSPLFADPTKFPGAGRTFVLSCEYDYMGHEAREFKDKLVEAGREPTYVYAEGLGHAFDVVGTSELAVRRREAVYGEIVEMFKSLDVSSTQVDTVS